MFNKSAISAFLVAVIVSLPSCHTFTSNNTLSPMQQDQVCENLRLNIMQNSSSNDLHQGDNSPTREAYLYKQYTKYDCQQKEALAGR